MELGSLFLILALALLVGFYIGQPFLDARLRRASLAAQAAADSLDHVRSGLLAERDRLINALLELDFDYALGKIPEEDYPVQRETLRRAAVEVLRQLDALQSSGASGADAEARLEAALAHQRAEATVMEMDEIERLIAERRRERQGKGAGFCPRCGHAVQRTDRFCPKCGASL